MSWSEAAARARGLTSRVAGDSALAALDRARDRSALIAALGAAGFPHTPDALAIEDALRTTTAGDLASLARWVELDAITLDEDRRSLRAIVRGLAATAPVSRKVGGTIATPSLDDALLGKLAAAPSLAAMTAALERAGHPFASALAPFVEPVRGVLDLVAIEQALARRFAELAGHCTGALRIHVAQIIDAENAAAALQIAARDTSIDPASAFVPGGERLGLVAFLAACRTPERLAVAFAHTPLASAVLATRSTPRAFDDAVLAWHLTTQARLRRIEPHGPAAVIYLVLRRRVEARHLRRAAWRLALGTEVAS